MTIIKTVRNFLKIFRRRKTKIISIITPKPVHVAVIMDGNGRWASAKGLTRVAGHKQGVDSVKNLIKSCINHEVPYLSIFAFSSENWSRPSKEISALTELLGNALETQTKKLNEYGVKLKIIGDLTKFSTRIQRLAENAQAATAANSKLFFSVAINYGGRWDMTQACRQIADKVALGELSAADIDEQLVGAHLATNGIPDPDLFIRTSGEYRISNFLLWQAAYSEFYFTDTLWPDFDENAFTEALLKYTHRNRRFGSVRDKGADEIEASAVALAEIETRSRLESNTDLRTSNNDRTAQDACAQETHKHA